MNGSSPSEAQPDSLGSLEIPGGWAERTERIGGFTLDLLAPADPDAFLNCLEEAATGANAAHLTDPYWSAIWSAAPALAERVARQEWPAGTAALELGCGVGLVGLAALAAGMTVTFSDYIPAAISLALENARRNGFSARARGLHLDWRDPPLVEPYSWVLAADVLYEKGLHEDLLGTLDRVLTVDGQCWIGDPGRSAATDFAAAARRRGFEVSVDSGEGGMAASGRAAFQLLTLRRAGKVGQVDSRSISDHAASKRSPQKST